MITLAIVSALTILLALAVMQTLAALGLPLGRFLWGGQHRTLPTPLRIGSAASVLIYAGMAILLLCRSGILGGEETTFVRVATWVLFGYFVLGCVVNAVSRSRPERYTMTPATIVLAVATFVLAATS